MTIEDRLNESLTGSYDAHTAALEETWHIRTDDDAAWASRKAEDAHGHLDRINAWAERERARIDAIVERETKPHVRTIDTMTTHLQLWLQDLIRKGRKTKSVDLPGGRISIRTQPATVEVSDEGQFLAWAKENAPELIRVKESVNLPNVKKRFEVDGQTVIDPSTGEVVPHVIVRPESERASFKTKGES